MTSDKPSSFSGRSGIPAAMTRRTLLQGAAAGAGAAALGGPLQQGVSAQDSPPLIVAQTADIETLDPPMHRARATQNVHQLIYDSLVHRDENLQMVGHLAESWEVVDDVTYRFTIREGATWQDGSPVTAHDVKFSYDRTLDPATQAPRAGLLDMVESTEAVDDRTVEITTKFADPLVMVFLTYHAIVPMNLVTEQGEAFFEHPVGAGPYAFESWQLNEQVVLKANPNYWDGAPLIDTVIIRAIPDPATLVAELESGGVDIVPILPASFYEQVQGNSDLTALTAPGTAVNYVGLNTTMAPFDNVLVRQALNHAIDRDTIIAALLQGLATPISGPFFPEVRGFDPDVAGYAYDVDKAKALLEEAGLGSGFDATLDTVAANKEVSEAMAGMWQEIGVNVTVNTIEPGVMTERTNSGQSQMWFSSWGDSSADAGVTLFRHFHSSQRELFKDTGYSREDLDQIIDEGRATIDLERRAEIFREAHRIVVDDAPWVFLWQPTAFGATRANVQGFVLRPDGYFFLHKVSKG
ncbi:MAG: ABC transporter substrate-binding protein [Thermomicrobiales bacterium]|nr:ABC transporter substrate-binding protein [Thermomicrobiales bacterium]